MSFTSILNLSLLAGSLLGLTGCTIVPVTASGQALTIERQGSFFVGGRLVTAAGSYDLGSSLTDPSAGQSFWVDQMYVHYQIPPNARKLPLVLVHGGGGTGMAWESTPDGREGFQTLFVRRGFAVYTVDMPRGGRAGIPSFNSQLGKLGDRQQVVPDRTSRTGHAVAWVRWRLGPRYPETFPVQAFPMEAVDQFMQGVRATMDVPEVNSAALVALLDKIGPAIVVTHSASGLWGWLGAAHSPNAKAVVSYEPGFVFPRNEMPQPVPLFKGTLAAGNAVTEQEFANLAKIPIQVVYGDNIPKQPVAELPADGRRAQAITADQFTEALNRRGGKASVLHLPDAGLRGNSHFMYMDRNNIQVADQLSAFLSRHGLDAR